MLKNAYFFGKKALKILSASGVPPPNPRLLRWLGAPPPDSRVVTSAYYYSFVKFISRGNAFYYLQKKNKITTLNLLFWLLPHFFTYFSLQTGGARIFLALGRRVP